MSESAGEETSDNPLATVLSGGLLVSASKFVALGFGYATQVFLARFLSESGYGDVVLTLALANVAVLVATLGLDDGLMREFPNYEDVEREARGVVRAGLVVGAVSGTVVAVALYLAAPVLARDVFADPGLEPLLRIAAVGVPFVVLRHNVVALARGARDATPHAVVDQLVWPGLRLLFIGALLFAGVEAAGALTGHVVAVALAGVVALAVALRSVPSVRGPTTRMYRPVIAFSLPLIAVQGMNFLNSSLDIYMVGYFLNSARVGVYNIALQLGQLTTVVLMTVAFLLPPIITRLDSEGRHEEILATYQGVTKWMAMLSLPVFLVVFFLPEPVIGLTFGGRYTDGALVLQILTAGKLVAVLAGLNFNSLIAFGENRVVSYLMAVQLAMNFGANLLLVPAFGVEGAAVALTVSSVTGDLLGAAVLYRQYGVHPVHRALVVPVAVLGLVAATGYAAAVAFGLPGWLPVVLAGAVFPVVVVRFALEPRDEALLGLFEERIGRELTPVRALVSRLQ